MGMAIPPQELLWGRKLGEAQRKHSSECGTLLVMVEAGSGAQSWLCQGGVERSSPLQVWRLGWRLN